MSSRHPDDNLEEFVALQNQLTPAGMDSSTNSSNAFLHEESKKYSDFVRVTALVIGIPIIIFGVVGNLMTIIAVIKTKSLRTGENIFIICLSVCDLMCVTISLPTSLPVIWNNAWIFSKAFCKIYPVIQIMSIGGNLMSLSGTAVSRYLKIIHPNTFRHLFGRRRNIVIIVSSFFY